MKPDNLISKFKDFVLAKKLLTDGDITLIGLSGGADSVVLCHLFKVCGYKFAIAHCNFQLRHIDSDRDAEFVKELATKLDVPFHSATFDTISYKEENKLSLEEASRILRYDFFAQITGKYLYNKIATAHHANDAIETFFLHLVKGTGIRGITGIPVKNKNIIRPLLFASKQEITLFAEENNISFRTDASNAENIFHRNRIRNEIIPRLKDMNPSFEETMLKNLSHFSDALHFYDEQVQKKLNALKIINGNDIYFPIGALKNLPAPVTCLHELLFPFGFNEVQVNQIYNSFGRTGIEFFSVNTRVIIDRKYLIITNKNAVDISMQLIGENERSVIIHSGKLNIEISKYKKGMHFKEDGSIAYFDLKLMEFPLTIRKWRAGDYLYPLGLTKKHSSKPGKKKVSDIITDLKLNPLEKENTLVLLSGEKIIWLVGLRQDERFKITESTGKLIKIKFKKDTGS